MKKNNIYKWFAGVVGVASLCSCGDAYLDKKIDVTENEAAIYSDSAKVAGVINNFYDKLNYSFMYNRFGRCALDLPSLESEARGAQGSMGMYLAQNTLNSSNTDQAMWKDTYNIWRSINIFMNNYNNGMVGQILSSDPNKQGEKLQKSTIEYWKGQAFFCRAWYVFSLIKHYGGIPLIGDRVYGQEEKIDVPRATYEESIKYVLAQCDSAYNYLMDSGHEFNLSATDPGGGLGNTSEGRACALMCTALKARVYLYAASPLVNTSREDDPDHFISYGNTDKNRWKLAYDAAKEVIDYSEARSDGYALDDTQKPDNSTAPRAFWPNFYKIFLNSNSREGIICFMYKNDWSADATKRKLIDAFFRPVSRPIHGAGSTNTGFPTQELVDAFPMEDGFPIGDARSKYKYADGDSMYAHRDPRLRATVSYNGAYRLLEGFPAATMKTYTGDFVTEGTDDEKSAYKDGIYQPNATSTGYYRMKLLCDEGKEANTFRPMFLMRYAEILLIAAEAANELNGGPTPECYKYLRMIRKRAGIEKDNKTGANEYGVPDNMSQDEMRKFIQRERQVEFAFEEQRYWDIRRWKIAPEVCNTISHGMEITRHDDGNGKEHFTYRRIEVTKHVWDDRLYWWPIPKTELVKSPALKQNPGY